MVDVALYIRYAKVAQVKDFVKMQKNIFLKGGTTVQKYVRVLEIVRKSAQFMYDNNPSETTLDQVANYMYNLSGRRTLTPAAIESPFLIVIQPQSQSVDEGNNVTFSVVVAGGTAPYTYQWKLNGTPLVGETNDTLNLTNVDSGDQGNYSVVITDNEGQELTSVNAALTVIPAAITGFLSYGDVDPDADLQAGVDNFTYQESYSITHNAPVNVPIPLAGSNNKYIIVKIPNTESNKTIWYSTAFNNGTIPDFVFQSLITFGGFDYYYTRNASSFDPSVPLILS